MRTLGALLAICFLACNSTPTDPLDSNSVRDTTIVVANGSTNQVTSDLRVAFMQLIEDSRCPSSVVCVWAGNGAVRLDITSGSGTQSVTLNTTGGPAFPSEATVAGLTFTLVELNPARKTPDPIPAQQYRATIRVTRAQ
jgi:hypothetical protein